MSKKEIERSTQEGKNDEGEKQNEGKEDEKNNNKNKEEKKYEMDNELAQIAEENKESKAFEVFEKEDRAEIEKETIVVVEKKPEEASKIAKGKGRRAAFCRRKRERKVCSF